MISGAGYCLVLLAAVASSGCNGPTAQLNDVVTVTIDTSKRFQTIEGWGASMRLFSDPHIIGLPQDDPANALQISQAAQSEILDSLYRGIGLTRVRVATETGGIEVTNDDDNPAHTNTSGFDFSGRNNDAFFGAVTDLRTRGMSRWWMSPIGIPDWIREAEPAEYVELAMAINRRWRDNGLELPYYSIANEPTGQGLPFQNGEYLRDVVKLLGRALESEGFKTKLVIPDDIHPSSAADIARIILADPEARRFVGAVAFHLYGEPLEASAPIAAIASQYGIPLWMSEFYTADWMQWAIITHSLLSDYNATAVDYLAGFLSDSPDDPSLIALRHSGTSYLGYRMVDEYYAFGNFTRYVRPGAVRLAASSDVSDLKVSAFEQDGKLAVVAINESETDTPVHFNFVRGAPGSFNIVRTSAHQHLAPLPSITLSSATTEIILPGRSITTFYQ